MRKCYGDIVDSPEAKHEIDIFNERQKLLRKLVEKLSDDFKKRLLPDDLKFWEELPLKTRGFAEPDEGMDKKDGRVIVIDAKIWQRKKDE